MQASFRSRFSREAGQPSYWGSLQPLIANGLRIARSYIPPSPGSVQLDTIDVVDNDDGTVTFGATDNPLAVGDEINLVILNYSGTYSVVTRTADTFTITATWVDYTVTAGDVCYLQPRWPRAFDDVLLHYAMKQHYIRDGTSPKAAQLQMHDAMYAKLKTKLKEAVRPATVELQPARDTW